jgi:hypothetical protein
VLLLNSRAGADLAKGRQKLKGRANFLMAGLSTTLLPRRGGTPSGVAGAGGHFHLKKLGRHSEDGRKGMEGGGVRVDESIFEQRSYMMMGEVQDYAFRMVAAFAFETAACTAAAACARLG